MPIPKIMQGKIIAMAMKGAFKTQENDLTTRTQAFSAKVYRALVSEDNEKLMRKLPTGYFRTTRSLIISLNKTSDDSWHNRLSFNLLFDSDAVLPTFMYDGMALDYETSKPFIKTVELLISEREGINAKRNLLREKIGSTVGQAKSVKHLVEIWPESAEFIPEDTATMKKPLIVLPEGLTEALRQAKL